MVQAPFLELGRVRVGGKAQAPLAITPLADNNEVRALYLYIVISEAVAGG